MNGKHPCTCTCLDCIAYLEQEVQCDIDEWMPDHEHIPQILCPSNSKEAVPRIVIGKVGWAWPGAPLGLTELHTLHLLQSTLGVGA